MGAAILTDDQAYGFGYRYKVQRLKGGYAYARDIAEANAAQRREQSHDTEAPPVELLQSPSANLSPALESERPDPCAVKPKPAS